MVGACDRPELRRGRASASALASATLRVEGSGPGDGDDARSREPEEAAAWQRIFGDAVFAHWGVSFGRDSTRGRGRG